MLVSVLVHFDFKIHIVIYYRSESDGTCITGVILIFLVFYAIYVILVKIVDRLIESIL